MKKIYYLLFLLFSIFTFSCKQENIEVKSIEIYKPFNSCYDFEDITLFVTFTPLDSQDEVIWNSSDENIAIIDNNGKITFTGSGVITITAYLKENEEIKDTYTFEVIKYIAPHECEFGEWEFDQIYKCGSNGTQVKKCLICGEIGESREKLFGHKFVIEEKEATCTEPGEIVSVCEYCEYEKVNVISSKGHTPSDYEYSKTEKDGTGRKTNTCLRCGEVINDIEYANNGFFAHGKLTVVGTDLVDKDGDKVQLYGLSTHGVQWFGKYLNYNTIEALQNEFGINVIRFAFYTDENGYCSGSDSKKRQMLIDLKEGIDAASKLGLYVIIDWHMVGAENPLDKNPLTYLNESKEFFGMISQLYKDYDNIIYEIMNEPNGSTTWDDCKKYANEVIPCIRKNTEGIILVGNPKWTADLYSVCASPLYGFSNIMYTYHFYAADHKSTAQVEYAYSQGVPVFISEYGMMLSSGDGEIDEVSGMNWIKVLDDRNISYVAWNISNSGGSASIFKEGSTNMVDLSDGNLKEWGIFLKEMYRRKSKLDN